MLVYLHRIIHDSCFIILICYNHIVNIAVIGANGYIGRNLVERLLLETDHSIVALSPTAKSMTLHDKRLTKHNVDILATEKLHTYLKKCDAAYYLIHMMAQEKTDFAQAESEAARSFCTAATGSGIKRVIYLGGLGRDKDKLSKHLASRHKTGEILRSSLFQVIEFRASIIVGQGSVSFDIVTNAIQKLPILTLPDWGKTQIQPIGLHDCISYLISALKLKTKEHQIIEIGGPEKLSYGELMKRYAKWEHKKMIIMQLHLVPAGVVAWWLNLFAPKTQALVGRNMVQSLSNPMVVTNDKARELFPNIHPKKLEEVFV
jgi:uncharacterized protein YbjT (DUF2867 family)